MTWVGLEEVPFTHLGMTQEMWDLIEELSEDNEYWKSAYSFVGAVKHRRLDTLTDKQRAWLEEIIATLRVELNRKTAREVFEC